MKEEERNIFEALKGPILTLGYDLVEVRLSGNKTKTLSVTVDRVTPISLEDIVTVSDEVNKVLDELDPIQDPYVLDVSSLGVEKPIDIAKLPLYVGQYVNLHLVTPYKGDNILEGRLQEVTDEEVTLLLQIKVAKKAIVLPRRDIDKARLAIEL